MHTLFKGKEKMKLNAVQIQTEYIGAEAGSYKAIYEIGNIFNIQIWVKGNCNYTAFYDNLEECYDVFDKIDIYNSKTWGD